MSDCILCQSSWQDNRHDFRLQPRCAGVRILTLDSKAIRGIVEISLLEKLVKEIDLNMLLLIDCFDLIMERSRGKYNLTINLRPFTHLSNLFNVTT